MITKLNLLNKQLVSGYNHPFHLVIPSGWPILLAFSLWFFILNIVLIFHNKEVIFNNNILIISLSFLILILIYWWRDIIYESTFENQHTPQVRQGLLFGICLFIISEIFLFFGFFWAFFNSSLVPSIWIGNVWPPIFIEPISPWKLPLVNTLTLILSGFSLTIAHRKLKYIPFYDTWIRIVYLIDLIYWIKITLILAFFFLFCQIFEYYYSSFFLTDTIFATTFYSLTGLHGIHVLVGTIFLFVCLCRAHFLHFSCWKQVGFKSAVWYWHFVDIVWILLFFTIYIWGGIEIKLFF